MSSRQSNALRLSSTCSSSIWRSDGLKVVLHTISLAHLNIASNTYHVATHGDEEIKEDLATLFHLCLHRSAFLEVVAVADDDGEVVTTNARLAVGSMFVCPSC